MSKFYYYFGKIIFDVPQKNDTFLGENSLLPSQCPNKQLQYGRSGPVGGSIPPWSSVARYVFQLCLSMYLLNLARARSSPQFWHFNPSPIFPKICHYFGTFTPSRIFPKICHNFGTFHEYKLWELSFCVSVILNLPHATVALLNSL